MALLVALAVTITGCGIPDQSSPVPIDNARLPPERSAASLPRTPTSTSVTLYFVNTGNRLLAVTHTAAYKGLNATIGGLLDGPTQQETSSGATSAIPAGTKLISSSVNGSVAQLDFSNVLASVSGQEQLLAFAQIVATATTIPGINAVQVAVAGQSVNAPLPDGTLAQEPVTRSNYTSLLPP